MVPFWINGFDKFMLKNVSTNGFFQEIKCSKLFKHIKGMLYKMINSYVKNYPYIQNDTSYGCRAYSYVKIEMIISMISSLKCA